MAGRGRGAVLPAWMQGDTSAQVPAPGSSNNPPSIPTLPPDAAATAAHPSAPGSSPAAQQWRQHTAPDGRLYYYNKQTKVSTWKRPPELGGISTSDPTSDWRPHTAPNGRQYWYNKVTKESRWTPPEGLNTTTAITSGGLPTPSATPLQQQQQQQQATAPPPMNAPPPPQMQHHMNNGARGGREGRGSMNRHHPHHPMMMMMSPPPAAAAAGRGRTGNHIIIDPAAVMLQQGEGDIYVPKPGAIQPGPTIMYATPSDARAAFMSLLDDANIPVFYTWDQAMKILNIDHRYGALPSIGEKKQVFVEWMQEKKKEEAEEVRRARKLMKERFYDMLNECRELVEMAEDYFDRNNNSSSSRKSKPEFVRADELLHKDPRWTAVQSHTDREDLFYDWIDDIEVKVREREREKRKGKLLAFKQLLKENTPKYIKACTSWRRTQDKLGDKDAYQDLDKVERLEVFSEYIKELEEKEKQREDEEKKMEKRRERKARDVFIHLLQQQKADGMFHCRTKWREHLPLVQEEDAYLELLKNTSGSRPKELFYSLLTQEDEEEWQQLKKTILPMMKSNVGVAGGDITFDQFYTIVCQQVGSDGGGDTNVSKAAVRLLYLEKMDPYIKAKNKAKQDLMVIFDKHNAQLTSRDVPWETVVEVCGGEWGGVVEKIGGGGDDDDAMKEVYAEYWRKREEEQKKEVEKERKRRRGEEKKGVSKKSRRVEEEDSGAEEGELV